MRYHEAAAYMGILLAMAHLKKRGEIHSLKNIMDALHGHVSHTTVIKVLENLERYGVIRAPYGKGKRRGRSQIFDIYPRRLPSFVVQAKPSKPTSHRYLNKLAETDYAKHENGKYHLQSDKLVEDGGDDFLKGLTALARSLNPGAFIDGEWMKNNLDHDELNLENSLELFHRLLCSQEKI